MREVQRHRLGAQGVGFAVQFLHQKIQPLADGAGLIEHAADLGKVGGEAGKFFVDIGFLRRQRDFLRQPFVPGFAQRIAQAFRQLVALRRGQRRQQGLQAGHLRFGGVEPVENVPFQLAAFALAALDQFVQRRLHALQGGFVQSVLRQRGGLHRAGPAQDLVDGERRAVRQALQHVGLPVRKALKNGRVEAVIKRGGRQQVQADAALHLAARETTIDQVAQLRLQRAELIGQAEVQFEKALIDAAQIDADAGMVEGEAVGGKPGHAGGHGWPERGLWNDCRRGAGVSFCGMAD